VNFDQAKVLIGSAAATFIVGKLFNRKKKKEDNEKKSLTKWVKGLIYGVAVKKARGVILDTVKTSLNQRIEKKNNDY